MKKFKVGNVLRLSESNDFASEAGDIIKIIGVISQPIAGCEYITIRGCKGRLGLFSITSEFASSLELLTGKEIGEAIRKWDADHAKKEPKYREVKRPAKVGEKIKIVNAHPIVDQHYSNGDIFEVKNSSGTSCTGDVIVFGIKSFIDFREYVVLEGYKPAQKEERRKAKVGDTIKILPHAVDIQHGYKPGDTVFIDGVKEKPAPDGFIWGCGASYSDDDAKNEYVIISSGKHSYTTEQIDEAKKLCGKMMLEAFDDGNTFNLRILDKNYDKSNSAVNCEISRFNNAHNSSATARCSDHDEYSVWIGRCVALCKALHKPIPAFIMEG